MQINEECGFTDDIQDLINYVQTVDFMRTDNGIIEFALEASNCK